MTKEELTVALSKTTQGERDAIEAIITDGNTDRLPNTVQFSFQHLIELGLLRHAGERGLVYDGGPVSEFFELRVAQNFD